MSPATGDFLGIGDREFASLEGFISYIDKQYRFGKLTKGFNIIAAINNRADPTEFHELLANEFDVLAETGDLLRIHDTVEDEPVYSYVYLDDFAPLFLTNANKTDEIPATITKFLHTTPNVGRLRLSRREIDENRKRIVSEHENVMVPYFTAKRSADEPIAAKKRPATHRTMQYTGNDGLETYREMRYNYGVLPKIMTFEVPNRFKFKIKDDGTFVHLDGGLGTLWDCLRREISRVEEMVEFANTGSYGEMESSFLKEEDSFSVSKPWAVEVTGGISAEHVETLPTQLDDDFWEFSVSEYFADPGLQSFEAEVIDNATRERTAMKTKGDDIRIFPREFTDIDQSLRLYNFISDHFDADCTPKRVA